MEWALLFKGIAIGFLVAMPVGPIGILCIHRTLTEGRLCGLASGIGAATADAVYGGIAGFGLTFISDIIAGQHFWIRLIGGGFLCYLGIMAILRRPLKQRRKSRVKGALTAYSSTFLLTLTNPMTILSFAAIFAGMGLAGINWDYPSAGILIMGVFFGSALWWFIISGTAGAFKKKFTTDTLLWLNRVSGTVITGFGLLAILSLAV